jgi:hypothetical protein
MNNPYTSIFAPQSMQGGDMSPQMMNTSGRDGLQNALNSQGGQLAQQALSTGQSPASGVNPFALAQALRQGAPVGTGSDMLGTLGARADMAMNSQASPMLQDQVSQLGSSTSNPLSNYNMGTNGWGNYGE